MAASMRLIKMLNLFDGVSSKYLLLSPITSTQAKLRISSQCHRKMYNAECRQITNFDITCLKLNIWGFAVGRHVDDVIRAGCLGTQPAIHNYCHTRETFFCKYFVVAVFSKCWSFQSRY